MTEQNVTYIDLPGLRIRYHELKTWPEYYWEVVAGRKKVEIRKNDRYFCTGDLLCLVMYDPETETKHEDKTHWCKVTHVLEGQPWLPEGYVAMSIATVDDFNSKFL